MRQPHTTLRQPAVVVYPWRQQIQEIRQAATQPDAPDRGADLFELLETRSFRRASAANGPGIKPHDQELAAFSAAIDGELQLAARMAPERMSVSQITQLLRLEQHLVTRYATGQAWVRRTHEMTGMLRDIHSVISREIQATRLMMRPLVELLDHEARLFRSQFEPVELWYWLLIDTTSGIDDATPLKRQILRPILNSLRLAAMLPDQPFFVREELLVATILCDLPLFAHVFRKTRRPISEQALAQVRRSHTTSAVAFAMGISDLPSHLLTLIAHHHPQSSGGVTVNSPARFLSPLAAIQSITIVAELLADHQARQPLHEVPLSAVPASLTLFQSALLAAQAGGQANSFNLQKILAPWRINEAFSSLPATQLAPETPLERLQRLLQQSHLRLDPPEELGAPQFQTAEKRDRKRRLTSYPGLKKRV